MKRGRLVSIVMCLMLVLSLFSVAGHGLEMETTIVQAAENDAEGYKIAIGTNKLANGEAYFMESSSVQGLVEHGTGGFEADEYLVVIDNYNKEVVEVVTESTTFTLKRKGPGSTQVTFQIKDGTGAIKVQIYCNIVVNIELTNDGLEQVGNEYVMKLNGVGDSKSFKVKYYGGDDGDKLNEDVRWDSSDERVATVDDAGNVTAVGAGVATIFATIMTGNEGQDELPATRKVVVLPKASFEPDATKQQNLGENLIKSDKFTLYTNAYYANGLQWKVYRREYTTGNDYKEKLVDETMMTYVPSSNNGEVYFENVKAGTYVIRAYPDSTFENNAKYSFEAVIVVPFLLNQKETLVMGVGDTYNVLEHTNIPKDGKTYFTVERSPDQFVATATPEGLITAVGSGGPLEIIIKKQAKMAATLFGNSVLGDFPDTTIQKVTVIDGIKLNYNEITIKAGEKMLLELIEGASDAEIVWEVQDERVAKLDKTTGREVWITAGGKAGETDIYARQVIDGVTKTAKCTVKVVESATKVTLKPNDMEIPIGDDTYVTAYIEPNKQGIKIDLRWEASDPSIVELSNGDNNGVRVTGKKSGTVVLTVVDANSVVLGFCELKVTELVTGLELNMKELTAEVGDTYQLTVTKVLPEGASDKTVEWKSSDSSVVQVSNTGLLTMKKPGRAEITCSAKGDGANDVVATCVVTVKQPVTTIKLSKTYIEMYVGGTENLSCIFANDPSNQNVEWMSFDTSVVAVSGKSKDVTITATGVGKTQIVVRTLDRSQIAYCTVEVKQLPTEVKLATSELTLNVGEYFFMDVILTPADSIDTGLVWEVMDKSIASVTDTGKITGLKTGETFVMVKAKNDDGTFTETAYCKVTVVQVVEGLKIDPETVKLEFGETMELKPVFTPAEPTNKKIKWTSSDNTVVSIDENGKITALTGGKAVITAVADDGGYTSMCVVTVPDPVLTLTPSVVEIEYGETYELQAVFQPKSASVLNLIWATSDASKVTVDENGVITGQAGGLAVITAKTADGKCSAMCIVTVKEAVTTITLTPQTVQFGVGEKAQLVAEISNPNASSKQLKWSSSDSSIVSVDQNGRIVGKKVGKVVVTVAATDGSGVDATCEVEVVQAVESLSLNYVTKTIIQGESFALRATISPSGATYQNPVWECSDPDVVLIDEKGVVTGLEPGNVWITATADDYVGKSAKCYLTVIPNIGATSISALENNIVLTPGEKKTVVVKMMPANTTDSMTWISQDESVAKVNASTGEITAVSSGKTTVTVMTDSGKKSTITVTVVGLSRTSLTMQYYSGSIQLYVEGTSEKVRWYSSDDSVVVVSANGTVSTRGIGTAEIQAVVNGRTLICKVTVIGY